MILDCINAQVSYKKHKGHYSGKPTVVADNMLDRQFMVAKRTDIGQLTSLISALMKAGSILPSY
jgi:hypothetical protein